LKPRQLLATATIPDGGELKLFQRGQDFMIVLGSNELMNSRMSGSEEALATLTCDRLSDQKAPHLLIGGYGMGFTLRAALTTLGPKASLTVAEIVPAIVEWARGPMRDLTGGCLGDPRVRVVDRDVAELIAGGTASFDAILLDVDNGPEGLSRVGNDGLYSSRGLEAAKKALKPNGVLAVWSAAPDQAFSRRLGQAGFAVEEIAVRARHNGKGPRHLIWMASKRSGSATSRQSAA
jgi:spermidine synthase